MQPQIQQLLRDFREGLRGLYGARLQGVYLFGSYARGQEDAESDVDILVVLDQVGGYGAQVDRTGELTARLALRYGVSISRAFLSQDEWLTGSTPFVAEVRREALAA